jgi:hypothetical protein
MKLLGIDHMIGKEAAIQVYNECHKKKCRRKRKVVLTKWRSLPMPAVPRVFRRPN